MNEQKKKKKKGGHSMDSTLVEGVHEGERYVTRGGETERVRDCLRVMRHLRLLYAGVGAHDVAFFVQAERGHGL